MCDCEPEPSNDHRPPAHSAAAERKTLTSVGETFLSVSNFKPDFFISTSHNEEVNEGRRLRRWIKLKSIKYLF